VRSFLHSLPLSHRVIPTNTHDALIYIGINKYYVLVCLKCIRAKQKIVNIHVYTYAYIYTIYINMYIHILVPLTFNLCTGAGNAYSAAIGYNLAMLLPPDTNDLSTVISPSSSAAATRREAVIQSACRASATGAAVVACEGVPVPSVKLEAWMKQEAEMLRKRVRSIPLRRANNLEGAALTPPPAPVTPAPRGTAKGTVKNRRAKETDEHAHTTTLDTRVTGVAKARGRGKSKRVRGNSAE